MASLVFRKRPSEGMNDVETRDTGHFQQVANGFGNYDIDLVYLR